MSQTDIESSTLSDIAAGQLTKINLNLDVSSNTFQVFLTILYTGRLLYYLSLKSYKEIQIICKFLNIKCLTKKLFKMIYPFLKSSNSDLVSFIERQDISYNYDKYLSIIFDMIDPDLLICTKIDLELLPAQKSHIQTYYKARIFWIFFNASYSSYSIDCTEYSKEAIVAIENYYNNDVPPFLMDEVDVSFLLNLLFYSDFFGLESLYNVKLFLIILRN